MTRGAVLVTGGAGYVGSHVAWAMIEAGREVVVLDNLSTGSTALVPAPARLVVGCAGDAARVRRLLAERRITAVLHLAGSADMQESMADPGKHRRNNTANTSRLMGAVAGAGLPLLFASTAAVYARTTAGRLGERDATGPASPYGASKLAAEQAVAELGRRAGSPWLALRYFNVAGADPQGRSGPLGRGGGGLFKAAADAALGRRPVLPIYGRDHPTPDGACVRDYIHVWDLARAHVQALAHLEAGGASGIVNCGSGRGASVLQVAGAVEAAAGRRIVTRDAAPRPGEASRVVCDDARLRALLPRWTPRFCGLEQMAQTVVAWEQRRAELAA